MAHIPGLRSDFMEAVVGRVINPNGVGKERTRLIKMVAIAIRELMQQADTNANTRDLVAFVVMALERIAKTIEQSVAAWEKRGYWVKADRFRLEWEWASAYAVALREAVQQDDWAGAAAVIGKIAHKVKDVKVSPRHRMGKPWEGAWEKFVRASKQQGR